MQGAKAAIWARSDKDYETFLFKCSSKMLKHFSPKLQRELEHEPSQALHLPSDIESVKTVVGWMEVGGGEMTGKVAQRYPANDMKGLENLRQLAQYLEIGSLVDRTSQDIERKTTCPNCGKVG